jgi:Zn-dependent protease
MLACPSCGKLVHTAELTALARQGEEAQRAGDVTASLTAWRKALELLPQRSAQYDKVHSKVRELSALVPRGALDATAPRKSGSAVPKWLAGLGALGLFLFKFKAIPLFLLSKGKLLLLGLTQAKTFFSMALAVGVYTAVFGWWFALGFVVSIYIHEMGHVAALRRYGISATAPMFIPGVGAFVRMNQRPATPGEDARVGLAGPIWGAAAAVAALAAGKLLDVPLLLAIGHVGAWVNLFNLLPVWQLDGSRAFAALSRRHRAIAAAALWACALSGVDGTIFVIAIVATVRAYLKSADTPPVSDRPILATYVALAVGLTFMMGSGGALDAIARK